ncbi:Exonuclease 1 [Smittium mucronatum]|uniref:Exonuclease 1 n=1 Tax=Smittium mucronatum TaxID=133383 RepID=A0A1R0GN19_9FUNG|nr:Exonuclease 1 [Smittium mucronatum]
MGITGLLTVLKEAQEPVHISSFKGQTLGIDGYVWLHKGAFGCSQEIALGQDTRRYVNYILKKIEMLRHFQIVPFVVFDGGSLTSKEETEMEREAKKNIQEGLRLFNMGLKKEAQTYFQRGINITPKFAKDVIEELKKKNIQYVVAPYEADAQLAYLEREGTIQGIITEDSDLIVYGCKKIIFKLDDAGNGMLFDRERLGQVRSFSLRGWTDETFRKMCILSGCDYLSSVHGVGLKRSHKYLQRSRDIKQIAENQWIAFHPQIDSENDEIRRVICSG